MIFNGRDQYTLKQHNGFDDDKPLHVHKNRYDKSTLTDFRRQRHPPLLYFVPTYIADFFPS